MTEQTAFAPADTLSQDVQTASLMARELVGRVADGLRQRAVAWTQAPHDSVARFCDALLDVSPETGAEHISALQARGVSLDALYSGWLAGAATELGRRWDEDEIGFAEVTLGMTRLHRMLHDLQPAFLGGRGSTPPARAFIAAAPGETHVFGPMMISDQLRRLGWQVTVDVSGDPAPALMRAVDDGALDVIGLSAATARVAPLVARLVYGLRDRLALSGAPAPLIVVGGALARSDPAALRHCGADVIARGASDIARALDRARSSRRATA